MSSAGSLSVMLLAAVTGAMGAPGAGAQPLPPGEAAKLIVGAWRYISTTVDGKPRDRGAKPTGMIYYGPHGEMSVHIAPDRPRPKAGPEPTGEEAKAAIADYVSYFGTYTIDERAGTVTHHRKSSIQPGDTGDFVRRYTFAGDRLILRPLNVNQEITWERIK